MKQLTKSVNESLGDIRKILKTIMDYEEDVCGNDQTDLIFYSKIDDQLRIKIETGEAND